MVFFVPVHLAGKEVLVKGKISKHAMSLKEARHYAEDAGKDPSKIKAPQVEYRIVASGVRTI